MKVMTFSDVRKNFAAVLDAVVDDAEECVIPRPGGQAVVLVGLDQWNSMKETLYVMGTRENAKHLLKALDDLDAGHVIHKDIDIPDDADLILAEDEPRDVA